MFEFGMGSFNRKGQTWLEQNRQNCHCHHRIDWAFTDKANFRENLSMDVHGATAQAKLGIQVSLVATQIEDILASLLGQKRRHFEIRRPQLLLNAMEHAVLGGGKRFRPFLVVETARLFGLEGQGPLYAGAALELIHCYSLVHDDLPAMDNDDTRRGKPTVHIAYDEATAILAGDALLTMAFDILADKKTAGSAATRLKLVQILAQTAGIGGMVGGQMLDLAAEGRFGKQMRRPRGEADIIRIQSMKTGALIMAACSLGAILGKASKVQMKAIEDFSRNLGLAFQIKDDLLDVEGDAEKLGKAAGKDADAGKATFVSLRGVEGARALLQDVTQQSALALTSFGDKANTLKALLLFNQTRQS
jgi:farnesyl diphosphate synthase